MKVGTLSKCCLRKAWLFMKNNLNLREANRRMSQAEIELCTRRIMLKNGRGSITKGRLPTAAVAKRREETGG